MYPCFVLNQETCRDCPVGGQLGFPLSRLMSPPILCNVALGSSREGRDTGLSFCRCPTLRGECPPSPHTTPASRLAPHRPTPQAAADPGSSDPWIPTSQGGSSPPASGTATVSSASPALHGRQAAKVDTQVSRSCCRNCDFWGKTEKGLGWESRGRECDGPGSGSWGHRMSLWPVPGCPQICGQSPQKRGCGRASLCARHRMETFGNDCPNPHFALLSPQRPHLGERVRSV